MGIPNFSTLTITVALTVFVGILSSCKSELNQDLDPDPRESAVPLPTTEVATSSAGEPASGAVSLNNKANELNGKGVKVSWPDDAFSSGFISVTSVAKVTAQSPTQTVLGSWALGVEGSDGKPMTAQKNGSIELSADLPVGSDPKSVRVHFKGSDGMTTVVSPIEVFADEVPLRVKFSSLLESGTYSVVLSPQGAAVDPGALTVNIDTPSLAPTIADATAPNVTTFEYTLANNSFVTTSTVTLSLAATDSSTPMEVKIGTTCGGGTWQSYNTSISYTHGITNNALPVLYAKFRDGAIPQNETTNCVTTSRTITHDTTATSAPSNIIISDISGTSLTLNFTGSSDALSGLDHYKVAVGTTSSNEDRKAFYSISTTTSSINVTGISSAGSGTYYVRIKAFDVAGNVVEAQQSFSYTAGWSQAAFLKASNADADDRFGGSIAISVDTVVVGAYQEDSDQTTIANGSIGTSNNNASDSGAAYVYKRSGGSWSQEAYLKAPNANPSDNFGNSVAVSGDTVVVGAYHEDSNITTITNGAGASSDNLASDAGAAYVFKRSGASWSQEAWLKAANARYGNTFGDSIAISGDTIVVGAFNENSHQTTITNGSGGGSDNSGNNYSGANYDGYYSYGAAYVFKRSGASWSQEAYLKPPYIYYGHQFGRVVSISGDTIVVGIPGEDSNQTTITNGSGTSSDRSSTNFGAAYVFKRSGTNWSQEAFLKAPYNSTDDSSGIGFGTSVSITNDTIVVGAPRESSNQTTITNGSGASSDTSVSKSGAAYVFKRTGSNWSQEAFLKASKSDVSDFFGTSVAISGDAIMVGAHQEDSNQTTITGGSGASGDNSASNAGAAYVFKRTGASWSQEAYLKAANAETDDYFGTSIAISGDTIVVGAYGEDSNQTTITNGSGASSDNSAGSSGAVYIFSK